VPEGGRKSDGPFVGRVPRSRILSCSSYRVAEAGPKPKLFPLKKYKNMNLLFAHWSIVVERKLYPP